MNEDFPKVTDNSALNFLNTSIVRNGKTVELLKTPEDLQAWVASEAAGEERRYQLAYLSPFFDTLSDVHQVVDFRNRLYKKIDSFVRAEASLMDIQQWLETELNNRAFFIHLWKGRRVLVPEQKHMEGFKSLIFLSLSDLLLKDEWHTLSHCENPKCTLLFLNKTGRRKWCSMKICGNRKKVERYEKKQRAENEDK